MTKIIAIAIIGVILLEVIKELKSEYTPVLTLCIGIAMIFLVLPESKKLYLSLMDISDYTKLPDKLFYDVMKICFSGYICKGICSYCDDFGYRTISNKVDLTCKIYVSSIAIKWVHELIVNINKLL